MKKIVLSLLVLSLGWASCVKEKAKPQLTQKEIQQKVDSIVAERSKELEEAGKVDLTLRYKIEVKVKADSIVNARKMLATKDTTAKPNPQIPMKKFPSPNNKFQITNNKIQKPKG